MRSFNFYLIPCLCLVSVVSVAGQPRSKKRAVAEPIRSDSKAADTRPIAEAKVIGKEIHFADGTVVRADEVWKSGTDLWYRTGGVTQRIARAVKSVEDIHAPLEKTADKEAGEIAKNTASPAADAVWVVLKGGARMKVDEVTESEEGAWCRRGNLSVLIESDRIEKIERESAVATTRWKKRDWTTGSSKFDQLIRANGSRFDVDPYLVFCVIEHESHFRPNAVSPKGAQGLMQLMPGTAARFGVRNSFDPVQNIYGGTQYLKELLKMFGGRVDLALASYNAGEGAVLKYGGKVPPYRETREYVKRISRRYGEDPAQNPDKR